MSADRNVNDLLRAFDAAEPAALLRTERTVRLSLGAVLVVQFLFPYILPTLFATWVAPIVFSVSFTQLSRATYLLGLLPWALFAAMMVIEARLLRRAVGYAYDDGQVLWMTLVPGYNLHGVWCLLRETGAALERAGAPADTARHLRRGNAAALALAVLVPLEALYSVAAWDRPVAGTELFVLLFLLAAARIFVIAQLHRGFVAEPVGRAIVEGRHAGAATATPTSTSTSTSTPTPTSTSTSTPTPTPTSTPTSTSTSTSPAPASAHAGPPRFAVAIGVALVAAVVFGALWVRDWRVRSQEDEVRRLQQQWVEAPPMASPVQPARAGPRAASVVQSAPMALPTPARRPEPPRDRLFGGRTVDWWQERIAFLRRSPGAEERALADLTVERARANGLSVREDGGVVRVEVAAAGGTP